MHYILREISKITIENKFKIMLIFVSLYEIFTHNGEG